MFTTYNFLHLLPQKRFLNSISYNNTGLKKKSLSCRHCHCSYADMFCIREPLSSRAHTVYTRVVKSLLSSEKAATVKNDGGNYRLCIMYTSSIYYRSTKGRAQQSKLLARDRCSSTCPKLACAQISEYRIVYCKLFC